MTTPHTPLTQAARADLLDLLASSCQSQGAPGAQLAVRDAEGREQSAAWGHLRAGDAQPVEESSPFPTGSVSKIATASLILMLVEDEDLELDESLADVFPAAARSGSRGQEWPTIRHVLSHRGGLASALSDEELALPSAAAFARRHLAGDFSVHAPGTVFSYSNLGYVLLAAAAEERFGVPWSECVEDILCAEARVAGTTSFGRSRADEDTLWASGHVTSGPGSPPRRVRQTLTRVEEGAGGLMTSAAGLLALGRAALSPGGLHRRLPSSLVLKDQGTAEASEPFGIADGWGLGWALFGDERAWAGHDGTADGAWAHVRVHPETGAGVALTVNSSTGRSVWMDVARELCPDALPAAGACLGAEGGGPSRAEACGTFANGLDSIRVSPEGEDPGAVRVALTGEPAVSARLDAGGVLHLSPDGQMDPYLSAAIRRAPDTGAWDLLQVSGRTARRVEET
jgi:CubicO group peptidase (beta-lactamase class C family)